MLFIDTKTSVLLQTAKIFVSRADDPNHRIQARLIFDTGSQRSYVSTRLRNALQLPTINQETLIIKTLNPKQARYNLVCYTAVFSVVTQRSSPLISGEERCVTTLKNGCVADEIQPRDLVQLCVQGMTSETYLYVNAYTVPIKDAYLG